MDYRIGLGYDMHRLGRGRKLFLGGLEIPFKKGLIGHSDADALLHAVSDALLGAAGEADIGELFPDTDPRYSGISSVTLLKEVCVLVKAKGFAVNNVDAVVLAEEPKLAPFKKQIRQSLAKILDICEECVNIKSKTNEKTGDIGKGRAIAAYAVAMLSKGE
ncbi:MAG: 2-C-methyl-D-erythritol 2,4-cyclodiphosphate synthase [Candidatus Omnitrophota bacterium]